MNWAIDSGKPVDNLFFRNGGIVTASPVSTFLYLRCVVHGNCIQGGCLLTSLNVLSSLAASLSIN